MQIVSQDWWEVREPQTRETGFVPGRCLLLISREEEHLYQAGTGSAAPKFCVGQGLTAALVLQEWCGQELCNKSRSNVAKILQMQNSRKTRLADCVQSSSTTWISSS